MAAGYPVKANYATGDVLTAANINDLSATVNYAVSTTPTTATQMAGKNKIINGDFNINQRNFSSLTADQSYGFDRWMLQANGGATYTPQTFTAGTAPVAGYEGINFARIATTGQTSSGTYTTLTQRIESVRSFAGQTITISFWAKATSGTPSVSIEMQQVFGTGGSPSANVQTLFAKQAITTSWVRYTTTATIPSISGKTLGTTNDGYLELNLWTSAGSTFNGRTNSLGIQTATIDFWGVQVEAGSTATPFQTATGTIQGELAAAQRYYVALANFASFSYSSGNGSSIMSTLPFPVTMRANPTVTVTSNGTNSGVSSVSIQSTSTTSAVLQVVASTSGHVGIYGSTAANAAIEL